MELSKWWSWFFFVVGVALVFNLWALADYPNFTSEGAAWVQAVGSIGAILVAVRVAEKQGEQTLTIARNAEALAERHADREWSRAETEMRLATERSSLWVLMIIGDYIEESDRAASLLEEVKVPDEKRPLTNEDRQALIQLFAQSQLRATDVGLSLIPHCERLPRDAASLVMRVIRHLLHYQGSLHRMTDAARDPGTDYAFFGLHLPDRAIEAKRIRESAKAAFDAVQVTVPFVATRAFSFTHPDVAHLAGPVEEVE